MAALQQLLKISEQGQIKGAVESFMFRPSEANKEILDSAFKGINLEDRRLCQIDFKNPETGAVSKITANLTRTNGIYLLAYDRRSVQQELPGKDDKIVGICICWPFCDVWLIRWLWRYLQENCPNP